MVVGDLAEVEGVYFAGTESEVGGGKKDMGEGN